jgi:predicted MFS family arabinose efflux permease
MTVPATWSCSCLVPPSPSTSPQTLLTSLLIPTIASRFDRRHVLVALTVVLLASLVLIACAPNFVTLMAARALLGVTVGGFWALSTATVMRLVSAQALPKALGLLYMGNAVAAAFAAPIGSYVGGLIGWRGIFWALTPLVLVNIAWQWKSLPSLRVDSAASPLQVLRLLKRRHVAIAMGAVMLTFCGAFTIFTYLRPFLETYTAVTVPQLSMLLLGLGVAGFAGTWAATALIGRHLFALMRWLPLALGGVTLAMLVLGHSLWAVGALMVGWGALNAAIPVCWSTWLASGIADQPDSGGGLMVAAIQLAIMLGGGFGGLLLDVSSVGATLVGGSLLLGAASLCVGNGRRLQAPR